MSQNFSPGFIEKQVHSSINWLIRLDYSIVPTTLQDTGWRISAIAAQTQTYKLRSIGDATQPCNCLVVYELLLIFYFYQKVRNYLEFWPQNNHDYSSRFLKPWEPNCTLCNKNTKLTEHNWIEKIIKTLMMFIIKSV